MWRDALKKSDHPVEYQQAWTQIIQERPQLDGFLERAGNLSLEEYGKSVVATPSKIRDQLIDVVANITSELFDSQVVNKVKQTLSTVGNIDTSSHGGIISEDTLVQSQLVLAEGISSFGLDTMVSLACGVVPMNNATWPRGFFRLGKRESIFPKSFDRVAVHECPSFKKNDIQKKLLVPDIDSCTKEILSIIDSIPRVYDVQSYSEQAQLINFNLWKQSFSASRIKNYIHLPLESVTAQLLCKSIEENDAISQLIFCAKDRPILMETLAGLPGTWTLDRTKGTFLFWLSSMDFRAASLWPEDSYLVEKNYKVPFTPEGITSALRSKKIVPSVFLSLLTLLYYGVRPLGGYHQIAYLPEYAHRLKVFSERTNISNCPVFTAQLDCADLIQLGYGFTFVKDEKSETKLAGMDYFLCNPIDDNFLRSSLNSTSVLESLFLNTRRLYNEIVPASKRTIFK